MNRVASGTEADALSDENGAVHEVAPMAISVGLVASNILMCGIKKLFPVAGTCIDVIKSIKLSHRLLAHDERLGAIETELTRFEKRMRDMVQGEIRNTLQGLCDPRRYRPRFAEYIRNLAEIQRQGWFPILFEGLLRRSARWEQLSVAPSQFGRVLEGGTRLDPSKLHVFVEAETDRILELTPAALQALLANQRAEPTIANLVGSADIWALRSAPANRSGLSKDPGHPRAWAGEPRSEAEFYRCGGLFSAPVRVTNQTKRALEVRVLDYWVDGEGLRAGALAAWRFDPIETATLTYKGKPVVVSEFRFRIATSSGTTPQRDEVWSCMCEPDEQGRLPPFVEIAITEDMLRTPVATARDSQHSR